MKKIFFGKNPQGKSGLLAPWGVFGLIWRTLVFLALLFLLVLILSLFRKCDRDTNDAADEMAHFNENVPRTEAPAPEYPDPDWGRPIPGGEDHGLPAPEDNVVPPYDEDDIINDPENPSQRIVNDMLYVIFDTEDAQQTILDFADKFYSFYPQPANNIAYYNPDTKTAALKVEASKRSEICNTLNDKIPDIDFYIVPVEVFNEGSAPNDPVFRYPTLSWFYDPIQAKEAWDITQGNDTIIIGIVDSYIDINHEDLRGSRIIKPYSVPKRSADVYPDPGVPKDSWGHGTLVTTVAAGTINNNAGSAGIAPNVKIIPVSQGANLNTMTMLEGLLYCIYNGAHVVNLSCGTWFNGPILSAPVEDQVEYARTYGKRAEKMWEYVFDLAKKHNVTVVWAAGNQNLFAGMDSSKRSDNTIRVSAVDRNLRKADFSNYGNLSDFNEHVSTVSAPGVDIFGGLPDNNYDYWPGTSFSAPIVTGAVALMKSVNPALTTDEIIEILQTTGKPVDNDPSIGPLIQIKDALDEVKRRMAAQ